jgi:predicted PurR-regulated permease PerM
VTLSAVLFYFGRTLLIPLFFGLLIAVVMYPVCKWLELKRISRSIAITLCLSVVVILFAALLLLLGWQISLFRQDIPGIVQKVKPMIPQAQSWLREQLFITVDVQDRWLSQVTTAMSGKTGQWLQTTLSGLSSFLFSLLLIPIYAALFLYHRGTFVRVLACLVGTQHKARLNAALRETVHTYFNYIKGMLLVYLIVGLLNSIGLLALGVKHALLFGMLTAIMTIIPYVGIIVSASIPVGVAFITKDSVWYPAGVVLVFSFVQYLEANVIFPKVVGTQLNVSTWAMLVAIVLGGLLWGVSGMVLFIPFVAILKIVSAHFEALAPLHLLLNRDASRPVG